jgi:16S rRNA (uracil1498-N3)-methyltransferase
VTRAVAQVFVEDPGAPELSDEDRHHLERVLRLREGELVVAADGRGTVAVCRFGGAGSLEPLGPPEHRPRPAPPIAVAFAPAKGDRPEWVVQKLTELGVDRIVPLITERSVVRWDGERAGRAVERLRRVAREAAAQSRQAWLPQLSEPTGLAELSALGTPVALADRGGAAPSLAQPVLAVGPEGGWSDAERALGLPRVALGDGVLRAETAAVAAGVLLGALRAALVRPGPAHPGERSPRLDAT